MPIVNPHPLRSARYSVLEITSDDTDRRKPGWYVFDNKKNKIVQEAFGKRDAEDIVSRKNS